MRDDIRELLARIDERTEMMLNQMRQLNGTVKKHNEEITKHKTYFKIIGAALTSLVIIFAALLPFLFNR